MKRLPIGVQARVLLRSLFIQSSWNYETLIGTGFAFTVLPVLRHLHPSRSEALLAAVARHTDVFNSHPYLATVAAGAVSRLEAEAVDPRIIERFKSALRGSLGSLGDQLVWSAGRPAAVILALALFLAGAAWWVAVLVFLVVYNAFHLALRLWGWRVGTAAGLEVGRALREAPLHRLAQRAADLGALLGGFALVLGALNGPLAGTEVVAVQEDPAAAAAMGVAAIGGFWLGVRARNLFAAVIGIVWILAIAFGWTR